MLPLLFFPRETFIAFPYAPTFEGQYIVKNLVLVGAAIVVGATVRGGQLCRSDGALTDDRRHVHRSAVRLRVGLDVRRTELASSSGATARCRARA